MPSPMYEISREGGTLDGLIKSIGLSGVSVSNVLLIGVVSFVIFTSLLMVAAKIRGASDDVVATIWRDVMIGTLCAFTIIGFLGAFFFFGRAIFTSIFGRTA